MSDRLRVARVERALLVALLVIAALQAIGARETVATDGVSYLDLAGRLRGGDLTALLDRYWSPLYPALLAVVTALAGGRRETEPAAAQGLNWLLFAGALWLFQRTVRALRTVQDERDQPWLIDARTPYGTVCLYAMFACGAVRFTRVGVVTPDLVVLLVTVAVGGALLRARHARHGTARDDIAFGTWLAVGYAAKAAMLPLALPALIAYGVATRRARVPVVARAALTLALLAAPYIALLSSAEGHLTTGETGRINLAWYIAGASSQVPDPGATGTQTITTPWERVVETPATYQFPEPRSGTYPAWSDPTRWQRGLQAPITLRVLAASVRQQLHDYYLLFGALVLGAWLALLLGAARSAGDPPAAVALALLTLAPIAMYGVVHVEPRFFGGVVISAGMTLAVLAVGPPPPRVVLVAITVVVAALLLWRLPVAVPSILECAAALVAAIVVMWWTDGAAGVIRRTAAARTVALLVLLAPVLLLTVKQARAALAPLPHTSAMVTQALRAAGAERGSTVASVGASLPAAWARWADVSIVAEVATSDTAAFWMAAPPARDAVLRAFVAAGARAVVGRTDRAPGGAWRAVPGTDYWVLPLGPTGLPIR
jgi:hypothetical protein